MIVDIILSNNIDTKMWIADLKENEAEHIIVMDYESIEEFKEIDGIIYMKPTYAFPSMSTDMSSLHRKNRN